MNSYRRASRRKPDVFNSAIKSRASHVSGGSSCYQLLSLTQKARFKYQGVKLLPAASAFAFGYGLRDRSLAASLGLVATGGARFTAILCHATRRTLSATFRTWCTTARLLDCFAAGLALSAAGKVSLATVSGLLISTG